MQRFFKFISNRNCINAKFLIGQHKRSIAHFSEDQKYGKDGHYDVLIVGGGATGLSLAGAISKNEKLCDKKILLLDGAPAFKGYDKNDYSNRVFAINQNTVGLLKEINAWNTIQSIRCRPVKQMQVWDGSSDALITFNHDNFIHDVAHIVENDVLLHAILNEIEKSGNIKINSSSRIEKVLLQKDGVLNNLVYLQNGQVFSADLLIGADGANSIVRKQMNVKNFSINYNQMGLIATLELSEPGDNFVAWQRFLPDGVIALLPLSDSLSSIVWSTDTQKVKQLLQLSELEFADAVNHAFYERYPKNLLVDTAMKTVESILGNYSQTVRQLPPQVKGVYRQSRAAFPLGFGHSSTYVGRGVALIGDAAHRVHPLAGMGLNLGFGDVRSLTRVLAKAAYDGFLLGDIKHLCEYESERLKNNVPIMLGIHGLQRLYNTTISPIVMLRSVGLQLTQTMTPLKKFFIEKAMG